ncbi:hypothetical protein ATKI12_1889 [Kitasatospora sp. Ki12]
MTDKLPRRSGGDGDEPAETPTERLLREAMGARAAQVTANSLRPAAPPKSRIRRLRPVYTVAVPLGLAAAMALGVLTFHGEPVAHDQVPPPAATLTTSPSPTAEPTTTPTPSATPTPTDTGTGSPTADPEPELPLADSTPSSVATTTNTTPPAGPSTPYTFRGVKFRIPAGWKAVPGPSASSLCVLAPGSPQSAGAADCQPYGALLTVYTSFDEVNQSGAWPNANASLSGTGWAKQPACPVWDDPHAIGSNDVLKTSNPTSTRDIVAGRPAYKSLWQVSCNSKESFTAQMWRFTQDQVYLTTAGLKPEHQAAVVSILDTLDLSGYRTPLLAPNENDIGITFDGLGTGQQVPAKGTPLTFSVTYRNTSQTTYASVQPALFTEPYSGSPASATEPVNSGRLERQDGDTWVPVPMSPTPSMSHLTAGRTAVFPLAPGQSRTVKFRLTLDSGNGPGVMPVTAQAVLPFDGQGPQTFLGRNSVPVRVVG